MSKTIRFALDVASIDNAIRELERYRDDFKAKCEQLRQKIAERIMWSAQQGFNAAMVSDTYMQIDGKAKQSISPKMGGQVEVTVEHGDAMSVVIADGEDAIFIEFGAGVYYNGAAGDSPHPWGLEHGFGIGTYGQGKGVRDAWGYKDENGAIILTHGTPAAMPMYRGTEEAIRALDDIVREVFGA